MRIIVQRVKKAQVSIEGQVQGGNQPRPFIAGWCWT